MEEIITTWRMASEGRPAMVTGVAAYWTRESGNRRDGQAAPVDMLAQKRAELVHLVGCTRPRSSRQGGSSVVQRPPAVAAPTPGRLP